ncbi:NAD-dependent epimerase/dehydratase family protein [Actinomarinicola tropica]|uniref:NAD-dependent epimerase/dehydratase family protein n=1 Tax=Actinomarinicola tropica TaxID=2789776 RepID=A0A5Q2RRB8_9ACTN|nr:NAD-dependent epimerase/dehydratase family protein [Actinomarinicola tropica]QGG95735.1 NAD-dependent epimerase/dehydratase family protein [Actinomarinicola tropica]
MDADPTTSRTTSSSRPRRVAVTGATGNVGVALLSRLLADPGIDEVVGLARRPPDWTIDRLRWRHLDLGDPASARPLLAEVCGAVDAVVHLAWAFQPTHHPEETWQINAVGSRLVVDAAVAAGVGTFVHQSSVGAYSPGPDDGGRVDEAWPTDSLPTAGYGREKAYVERVVDTMELARPEMRVVRFRPAFIFQKGASDEQRQIFAGWLLPQKLVADGKLPVLPWPGDLRFQALHAADMAEAIWLGLTQPVRGAFNLAAEPVIGSDEMAEVLDAGRAVHVPVSVVRAAVSAGWRSRLLPTEPALLDLVDAIPLLDVTRARTELGWEPRHTALDALRALVEGWSEEPEPLTPALADPAG